VSKSPKFDRSSEIVSVVVGKRTILPCYIQDVSQFKVIWMKMNNSSILTMDDRAVNGDSRITLLHAYADEWNLQIDDVDEDDAGVYRCVLNNGMYKTLTLQVKIPPQIIDEQSTESYPSPITSGSNFTLKCYANGRPLPKIRILSFDQAENTKIISENNEVILYNVSRHTRKRYECIASNGVPPDVARSFQLTIQYPPEVTTLLTINDNGNNSTQNQLFVDLGQELRIKCQITMYPFGKIFWTKNNIQIDSNQNNYEQYASSYSDNYVIIELYIKQINYKDFGLYSCFARNDLGSNSKTIRLIENPTTTTSTTTVSTTTTVQQTTISSSLLPNFGSERFLYNRESYTDLNKQQRPRKRPKNSTRTSSTSLNVIQQREAENLRVSISSKGKSILKNVLAVYSRGKKHTSVLLGTSRTS
ncbi:unnamed protein product, partial [Didymodactylos carnosus]